MPAFQLARLNIAKMKFALDDQAIQVFVARFDEVNARAFTFKQLFDPG